MEPDWKCKNDPANTSLTSLKEDLSIDATSFNGTAQNESDTEQYVS